VILVEGDLSQIAEQKNPRAFWGALLAFTLKERVTMLFTPDQEQTCQLLVTLHKQAGVKSFEYGLRHKPKLLTLEERQRFLVQGLQGVGETLSENLLSRFGTPRAVFAANERAFADVPKIGRAKAADISKVLDTKWDGRQKRLEAEDETV
jgi:Fanconi anemia group M protein